VQEEECGKESARNIGTQVPYTGVPAGHEKLMKFIEKTIETHKQHNHKQTLREKIGPPMREGECKQETQQTVREKMLQLILSLEQVWCGQTLL